MGSGHLSSSSSLFGDLPLSRPRNTSQSRFYVSEVCGLRAGANVLSGVVALVGVGGAAFGVSRKLSGMLDLERIDRQIAYSQYRLSRTLRDILMVGNDDGAGNGETG